MEQDTPGSQPSQDDESQLSRKRIVKRRVGGLISQSTLDFINSMRQPTSHRDDKAATGACICAARRRSGAGLAAQHRFDAGLAAQHRFGAGLAAQHRFDVQTRSMAMRLKLKSTSRRPTTRQHFQRRQRQSRHLLTTIFQAVIHQLSIFPRSLDDCINQAAGLQASSTMKHSSRYRAE